MGRSGSGVEVGVEAAEELLGGGADRLVLVGDWCEPVERTEAPNGDEVVDDAAAGEGLAVEEADGHVFAAEGRLPESKGAVVVEERVVGVGTGQDPALGLAALQAGGIEAEGDLVLATQIDADADVVEEAGEEVVEGGDFVGGGEAAVTMLVAEDRDGVAGEFGLRRGAEAGAHCGNVGFGMAAEGGAEGVAFCRVEGVSGEAGVVQRAAETRVNKAAAGKRRPVGREKVLERGGPGLLGSDQKDRASAHRSGPFPAREAMSAEIDGR